MFEGGVLRPLEPLGLRERQRVRLTVEDRPLPEPPTDGLPVPRGAEMAWLARHGGEFSGQWVAINGSELVAHGRDAVAVRDAARAAGVARPLLAHVSDDSSLEFGGW